MKCTLLAIHLNAQSLEEERGVGKLEKRDALSNSVNTKLLELGKNGQGLENCIHFDLDCAGRYGLYHIIRETLGNRLMLVQLL
jgi:hypothetical protein